MRNKFAVPRNLAELGCTVCFVLFFLLVIMTACFICVAAIGFISLFLLTALGYETTIYLSKVGALCAFGGIVIGHLAQHIARRASFSSSRRQYIAVVTATSYVVLVSLLGLVYLTESVMHSRQPARKVSCQNNLKQIGVLFAMYSDEHDSLPPLLSAGKRLIQSYEAAEVAWILTLHPWGLTPHFCPHDKKGIKFFNKWVKEKEGKATLPELQAVINKSSYMYLGYVVTNDAEMRVFAEAYKERVAQGLPFDTDLEVPPGKGTDGGDTILRLKTLATAMSSEEEKEKFPRIPVLWDRCLLAPDEHEPTFFHSPNGINVMFLDGHCEFIPYGDDRWPLTEETMRLFWELENL